MHFFCSPLVRSRLAVALLALPLTVQSFVSVPAAAGDELSVLLDQSDAPGDVESLLDELSFLKDQKIAVNLADIDDLLVLPFLSVPDARSIVEYRLSKGVIAGQADLDNIVGPDIASQIAPFLDFSLLKKGLPRDPVAVNGKWTTRWFQESPPRQGIVTGAYAGDNYKMYNRFQLTYGDIFISALQEKDTGEPDLDDFTSFSFNLSGRGLLRQLVAGNYAVTTGQGLLFGQSRYLSKGVQPTGVSLRKGGLKPYTSSAENGFMQGAGLVLGSGPLEMMFFYSNNPVDASVYDNVMTALRVSGYHRTESELLHRDNINEEVAGLSLHYRLDDGALQGSAGATVMGYGYGVPFDDAGVHESWYDAASFDVNLTAGSVHFFGEAALTGSERYLSWIAGAEFPLSASIESVIAVRDYHSRYFSPFAGAFAERADDAANEEGYYVGIQAKVLRNLQVGAYYDIFRFPELSRYYGLSSTGQEAKVFIVYRQKPSLRWDLLLQHQYKENAEKNDDEPTGYYSAVPYTSDRIRIDMTAKISRLLTLKTRGDYRMVTADYQTFRERYEGWLVYAQSNLASGPLSFKTRWTLFDTDGYDAAVYVYEDDLPQVFNLQSYYGRGTSAFALLSLKASPNVRLSGRVEKTWYSDRDAVGSGHDLRLSGSPGSYHLGCSLVF